MKLDTRKLFRGMCRVMRYNPDIMAEAPIQDQSRSSPKQRNSG